MRTRILGVIRCVRSKPLAFLPTILLGFAVGAWATTAEITVFELDGNSIPSGSDDWNLLNGTGAGGANPGGSPGGSSLRVFAVDGDGQTIFTGGGSKDNADVTSWANKSGSVPDKDEIQNAYAASYTAANGDVVIVFGADREAVNGDANIGFWFFQNPVGPNGSGGFTGTHTNGDVFVVSAFTIGGTTPGIKVYEWDSACIGADNNSPQVGQCADKNIRVLFNAAQTCAPSGPGHEACARVNSSPISVSWPYTPKGGSPGDQIPPGGFFEGAINVTELFAGIGQTRPCFASFLVETRSSQSIDAVLKDFVAHSFPQCHISLTKACACTAFHPDGSGFDYSFDFTVTNDGGGTVFNVTVTDQGKTYSCGTLNVNQSKSFADCAGPAPTFSAATFPATNQASASANTGQTGGSTITAVTDPVSCSSQSPEGACTPNPRLTVDKACVTALQISGTNIVVRVDFTGQVRNEGNVDIRSVQVTEDDNADGTIDQTFGVGTLTRASTTGASKCYTNGLATCPSLLPVPAFNQPPVLGAGSYFPNTGTGVDPGRVQFSDTVRATGIDAFGRAVESHPAGSGVTANCLICPFGACPTTSQ
jgi:hypothetical protein